MYVKRSKRKYGKNRKRTYRRSYKRYNRSTGSNLWKANLRDQKKGGPVRPLYIPYKPLYRPKHSRFQMNSVPMDIGEASRLIPFLTPTKDIKRKRDIETARKRGYYDSVKNAGDIVYGGLANMGRTAGELYSALPAKQKDRLNSAAAEVAIDMVRRIAGV